ncbi:DNA N-6-adenine-methyltransferase [Sphingomonas sp.]|uniref:DNA N-6-adenine-methyltransferase n=1 Tax=Sphingomonas sp. TaxID=28214 RepID=UPI003AFFFD46
MGTYAHRNTTPAAPSIVPSNSPRSQRRRSPRSNFIDELVIAREAEHRSVPNLAKMAGVTPAAIRKLEAGKGPVTTLVAVMRALPFQPTVLAPAASFAEQLRARRGKVGLSLDDVATKASLSPEAIIELENGGGSVENLLRLLSVIAPKVKRRAPERVYWGAEKKAERDSRFSPPDFMQSIYVSFGPVDIDPCAHRASPVIANRYLLLDQGDDGLNDPWSGRLAYVNPPYSAVLDWLDKAHDEWATGNVTTIVCLVPVRVDSPRFQDFIKPKADLYFLRRRLRFGKEGGKPEQTPHSLMLVIFGATARQKAHLASLVRGFWAPANDHQSVSASGNAVAAGTDPWVRTVESRFNSTSCAPIVRRNGRYPIRAFCGPSLNRRGEAR